MLLNQFRIGEFLKTGTELTANYDEVVFASSLLALRYKVYRGKWVCPPSYHSFLKWGQVWDKDQEKTEPKC